MLRSITWKCGMHLPSPIPLPPSPYGGNPPPSYNFAKPYTQKHNTNCIYFFALTFLFRTWKNTKAHWHVKDRQSMDKIRKHVSVLQQLQGRIYSSSDLWVKGQVRLCLHSCVQRPPTQNFNYFLDEKQEISLLWPNGVHL